VSSSLLEEGRWGESGQGQRAMLVEPRNERSSISCSVSYLLIMLLPVCSDDGRHTLTKVTTLYSIL
jgi:hypothetical protein